MAMIHWHDRCPHLPCVALEMDSQQNLLHNVLHIVWLDAKTCVATPRDQTQKRRQGFEQGLIGFCIAADCSVHQGIPVRSALHGVHNGLNSNYASTPYLLHAAALRQPHIGSPMLSPSPRLKGAILILFVEA